MSMSVLFIILSNALYFQWFQKSAAIGERIEVELHDGDMYVMSDKSVGFDWKKKKIATLRHATGCHEFTSLKPKSRTRVAPY